MWFGRRVLALRPIRGATVLGCWRRVVSPERPMLAGHRGGVNFADYDERRIGTKFLAHFATNQPMTQSTTRGR